MKRTPPHRRLGVTLRITAGRDLLIVEGPDPANLTAFDRRSMSNAQRDALTNALSAQIASRPAHQKAA